MNFEQKVSEALSEVLDAEAQKKEKSDTLRHWFTTDLASRVAAAIEAAAEAAYESSGAPIDRERWMHEAALEALRGVGVRSPADTETEKSSGVGGRSTQEHP